MNTFDLGVLNFFNRFSRHSYLFDEFVSHLAGNNLLKGGILATVIWWVWFEDERRESPRRKQIVATLISCFVAIAVGRELALMLPFRLRPLHQHELNFVLPYGMKPTALDGWSAFPSDHATLFFALSAGLFFASRKAGVFSLSYTLIFIALPRIYLGLHYPTDIIAGAFIGVTIALFGNLYLAKTNALESAANWLFARPGIFYPLFFLLTYQIADMFEDSRNIAEAALHVFRKPMGTEPAG